MTWLWGALGALALFWPDRISGPIDGVPLDRAVEAIALGAILPMVWLIHPRFLRTPFARACIVALLLWKIGASALLVQDGWCVRFNPERPYAKDATGAPHAWDLRADWRAADPVCSAIMTRSYHNLHEFPAWFFNLPPANDSWPEPEDRPPAAKVGMSVRGFLHAREDGVLRIETRGDQVVSMQVDGRPFRQETPIAAGLHVVAVDAVMTGNDWRLVPLWNGHDLWPRVTTTIDYPSRFNLLVRPWIRWIPLIVTLAFLLAWIASTLRDIGSVPMLAWATGASLAIGWLVLSDEMGAARWAVAWLALAVLVPVPPRLRNIAGALVMVGVPWAALMVVNGAHAAGRWTLYSSGDDWWMYQRFAYRIVMQGYWLEGGSETFYFQPFYRWIVGFLHMAFGDSSIGEWFWDSACLLAGSLLSFRIARTYVGFRWGLVAAVTPLAVMVLGLGWDLIGRGLGEISSAGLVSMAALCVIRSRGRRTALAVVAGVLATAAFYTRLNNLIIAGGVALFALSLHLPTRSIRRPRVWWPRVSWRVVFAFTATMAVGLLFFTWRTWHYTGVFSLFHGTQRNVVSVLVWQPGAPLATGLQRLAHSVLLVLTVNDPPRFDVVALPVMAGAAVAVLSIAGVPRLRTLPLAAVLFFFAAIASAFVAFGWAYTSRFSFHIMPITSALAICGVASLFRRDHTRAA